ncbi:MAG: carbon-phosphorus lyase complex subunit PhnI [Ktedonobacteraceae bacterium]|nr:carbon-phosphorus lyase complex subunit PhnI [Ktedonobacteraceae bacterium]
MGYVAVKGGLDAILAAEKLIHSSNGESQPLRLEQIIEQQRLAVDQIMGEAGLYNERLAALAFKQAEGDITETVFLLRAYKSTLERAGYSLPIETEKMLVLRRISSAFKNIPGGQLLGRTRDYTQRLLDDGSLDLQAGATQEMGTEQNSKSALPQFHRVSDVLREEGLLGPLEPQSEEPFDITRQSLHFPAPRSARLQILARGESGAMVAFGYSSMRGYGAVHPTISELRYGNVPVQITHPLTGKPITIGQLRVTEVEEINHAYGIVGEGDGDVPVEEEQAKDETKPLFELGYGLVFGQNERKAIAMAILDRALTIGGDAPTGDAEFVLYHIDSVESSGFVEHLKLPHYVTFQSNLDRAREERRLAYEKEMKK